MALPDDLRNMGSPSGGKNEDAASDREAFYAYTEACQLAGKTCLSFPAWIAAGRPKS